MLYNSVFQTVLVAEPFVHMKSYSEFQSIKQQSCPRGSRELRDLESHLCTVLSHHRALRALPKKLLLYGIVAFHVVRGKTYDKLFVLTFTDADTEV